jgi:hypothetical protein
MQLAGVEPATFGSVIVAAKYAEKPEKPWIFRQSSDCDMRRKRSYSFVIFLNEKRYVGPRKAVDTGFG